MNETKGDAAAEISKRMRARAEEARQAARALSRAETRQKDLALREANEALKIQPWHPDAAAIARAAEAEIAGKARAP